MKDKENKIFTSRGFVKRGAGFWVHQETLVVAYIPYYNTSAIKIETTGSTVTVKNVEQLDKLLALIKDGFEAIELKGATVIDRKELE